MSTQAYLAARNKKAATIGDRLPAIVAALVPLRREATDLQDLCLIEQAASTAEERGQMEECAQSLGALVRELSALLDQTKKCQAIVEQLERVETRLEEITRCR